MVGLGLLGAFVFVLWPEAAEANPSDYFVTVWKTDNLGVSNSTSVEIPVDGSLTYNYDVDWENDGTFDDLGLTGAAVHDYGVAGTYTVAIRGTFPRFVLNNTGDKDKLLDVTQWGTQPWESMASAFYGARNVVLSATDTPDLAGVSDLSSMFRGALLANPDTSGWDTSSVETMADMFYQASSADPDTSGWNTGSVTDMSTMFAQAAVANPDTSGWDTSSVEDMRAMFFYAPAANPDTSNWDTSAVTDLGYTFLGATAADPDTSGWDTSSVTDMIGMFYLAPLADPDTSGWDTSSVLNMRNMFRGASSANPDTSGWDTSLVTTMASMFQDASSASPAVALWDVSQVTTMSAMFGGAALAPAEYDLLLANWSTQSLRSGVNFDSGGASYCHAELGRAELVGTFGWTVSDGGRSCEGLEFVTVWQTDLPGASSATSVSIPVNPAYSYNYDVDWDNDGTYDELGLTGAATHDYGSSGVVEVAIRGRYPHFRLASGGDHLKLLEVREWGSQPWVDFSDSLSGAANATVTDTEAPELRSVTNLAGAFDNAVSSDPDLSAWDISTATDLAALLDGVALSPGRYDTLLNAWAALPLQSGVTFGAGPNSYCAGTAARTVLTDTYGWTVNDDGPDCQLSVALHTPTLDVGEPVTDTTITVTDLVGIQPGGVVIDGASTASYSSLACVADSATQVTCSIEVTSPGELIVTATNTNGHTATAQTVYSAVATTTTTTAPSVSSTSTTSTATSTTAATPTTTTAPSATAASTSAEGPPSTTVRGSEGPGASAESGSASATEEGSGLDGDRPDELASVDDVSEAGEVSERDGPAFPAGILVGAVLALALSFLVLLGRRRRIDQR